ncbi:MAG TPA: hypothetical protein DIW54_03430 [Chitinophagaceae bacterium]|nr:hypothetical protein [Chitinophagaceae bacterium]
MQKVDERRWYNGMVVTELLCVKPGFKKMKRANKIPRILKLVAVKGFEVVCVFNNGETRRIDFVRLFKLWRIKKTDPEYPLLDVQQFKRVKLIEQTLSWPNILLRITDMGGNEMQEPYSIDPVVLFEHSEPVAQKRFLLGSAIRRERKAQGLSQDALAIKSGTSKAYISRLENDLIEPELHTLYKIVELGLSRKIALKIE